MNKTKILKAGTNIAGAICLFLFVATKNDKFMSVTTEKISGYGELYDIARVTRFKVHLPSHQYYSNEKKLIVENINEAEIIVFGDSFLDANYGHYPFPAMLAEQLNKKVFNANYDSENPLQLLRDLHYKKGTKKYLLLESCERYLLYRFGKKFSVQQLIATSGEKSKIIFSAISAIRSKWFVNADNHYDYFFQNFYLFNRTGWNESLADMRFELAGTINGLTPKYSLNPPILFYHEGVESFEHFHSENEIEKIAGNILLLKKELEAEYNIELIFLPVPDKYTIYHTLINNDRYDNFIPRICERLKGVKTVELLEDYHNSKEFVFLPTDNHWNSLGAEIAIKKTTEQIN